MTRRMLFPASAGTYLSAAEGQWFLETGPGVKGEKLEIKTKKYLKKLLTNDDGSANICKLSLRRWSNTSRNERNL